MHLVRVRVRVRVRVHLGPIEGRVVDEEHVARLHSHRLQEGADGGALTWLASEFRLRLRLGLGLESLHLVRVRVRLRLRLTRHLPRHRCEDEPLPHAEALEVRAHGRRVVA